MCTAASADRRRPGFPRWALRLSLLAVLLPLGLGLGTGMSDAGPQVTGTGSSFAALAIEQWSADLASFGLNVNYLISSSVTGLNQFQAKAVDFGASEIGYSTNQANQDPSFAYQYLPDVAGGIAFAYNLSDASGHRITHLRLRPSTLAAIWTDQITNWDSPAIRADNPGVALPNEPIKVVFRADGAGESYILTYYLDYLFHQEWARYVSAVRGSLLDAFYPFPQGGSIPPGYNFDNWVGQSGSDAAAHYVSQTAGSLTYVETSWAIYYHLSVASMQNPSGAWVQPGYVNVAVALEKAVLYPDLEEDLRGVFTNRLSQSYPLSSYSYLLTQERESDPVVGAEESQFIYYLACAGQSQMIQLGYSPIPPNLVREDFQAAGRINGHQNPPPIDATHCKNPYVDGAIPLQGQPVVLHRGGSPGGGGPAGGGAPPSTVAVGGTSAPTSTAATSATGRSGQHSGTGRTGGSAGNRAVGPGGTVRLAASTGRVLAASAAALAHTGTPAGAMAIWSSGLLALLLLPAAVAGVRRRRGRHQPGRRRAGGATSHPAPLPDG